MDTIRPCDQKKEWATPELSRMGVDKTLSGTKLSPLEDYVNVPFFGPSDPDS